VGVKCVCSGAPLRRAGNWVGPAMWSGLALWPRPRRRGDFSPDAAEIG